MPKGSSATNTEQELPCLDPRSLASTGPTCVYTKDREGRYLYANDAFCVLVDISPNSLEGQTDRDFFDPDSAKAQQDQDRRVLDSGESLQTEESLVLAHSGESRVFWITRMPLRDTEGTLIGLCTLLMDITEQARQTRRMSADIELLNTVLANVDALIFQKSQEGRYLYVNQKVADLYGRPVSEVIGKTNAELLPSRIAQALTATDQKVFSSGERQTKQEAITGPDGETRHFWSIKIPLTLPGQPPSLIGFASEITELLELRQDLERQRTTDSLTGLHNRFQFESTLDQALELSKRTLSHLAVMLIDIDNFKFLNNTMGQEFGDRVLQQIARRLEAYDWIQHTPARFTANTFAIALPRVGSTTQINRLAQEVLVTLGEPIEESGRRFELTASMGISVFPTDGETAEDLIRCAESALYQAKEKGRDQFRFYSQDIGEALAERAELEHDLRAAVLGEQFELLYQPKMCPYQSKLVGFEALIRWHRPGHGLVSPTTFIPLAEQLGLIVPVGDWVIEQACMQLQQWREAGLPPVPVAVNLSPKQLLSDGLVDLVNEMMKQFSVETETLQMEVTESVVMDDPDSALRILRQLRRLGIPLSIDDFGTGYSSMAYLKQLPMDYLKVDRSFVVNIVTEPRDADLCAGIVALAHRMGLKVIAEGVDADEQLDVLRECDCDQIQGYIYSPPLAVDDALQYIRRHARTGD